jgi:hypothetical protein
MRSPIRLGLALWWWTLGAAEPETVLRSPSATAWTRVLDSVNLTSAEATWLTGAAAGVSAGAESITVRRIVDARRPQLDIYWETPAVVPRYELPHDARVFARERWSGAPVLAGWVRDGHPILWTATALGDRGYERYPYLVQALADLGVRAPAQSRRLWAFFDSSYRLRADLPLLARRWRSAGIAAIHVAAWHYHEPDATRDEWLRRLIAVSHQHAIQVYAWLELPHVSEQFWQDNPGCREKTALLADAHLDWRKLVNLRNAACSAKVAKGVRGLLGRFDWDGVNLGELYFESLEGAAGPARFTPMNDDVRREFQALSGTDPRSLFTSAQPDAKLLRQFLDYRAGLTHQMQAHWLSIVRERPELDVVLTHVDDRFDTSMRDALGADVAATLPLLGQQDFTFLVEDPATVWHLGPQRYPEIARRYEALAEQLQPGGAPPWKSRLGVDINIVERYQDVYPTKQQTGGELFQLVHLASRAFARVALYFENSILAPDLPWLAAASGALDYRQQSGAKLTVETARETWVRFSGPVKLDGEAWPVTDGEFVLVPAGRHQLEPGEELPLRVVDLNATLERASLKDGRIALTYTSRARGTIRLSDGRVVRLAPGHHTVYFGAPSS